MYAVIEVGAKQYSVKKEDVLEIEKQTAEKGSAISLDKVLFVSTEKDVEVGRPYVKGAVVHAEILEHMDGEKLISYKYRRRKASHRKKGHRQHLTRIKITDISCG